MKTGWSPLALFDVRAESPISGVQGWLPGSHGWFTHQERA
jgi:hypothetical protein